ncbi:universal stress protein [Halocatena marina]|uniref:Universal stress protein n=1 Tax=Halocatena marina TaxID=2934937 RepID=A0ABD5YMM1_9EURY|nr:universal stress protein [Halocatena marina]
MYHVVMGIATDDAQARAKAKAVSDLPGESISATIVHADDDVDLLSIPSISDVHDYLIDHGVDVSLLATDRTPANAILDTAEREDADLICIGGRHRSPAGKMQMRIGAEAIILNTNRPVLIAGRE